MAQTSTGVVPDSKVSKLVQSFRTSFQLSYERAQPHWNIAARHYQLWRGKLPSQLEGTFSKIMLNFAHSLVQERVPKLKENIFGGDNDFISLEAQEPLLELFVDETQEFLRDLLTDESKINIVGTIDPTLQSACILGNGYRMPQVRWTKIDEKWQPIITSKGVDFFQILPSANGGLINPMDRYSDECLDYFFFTDWWGDDRIAAMKGKKGFNDAEIDKLLATRPGSQGNIDETYTDMFNVLGGINFGGSKEDWRNRQRDIEGSSGRRRVVSWHMRDKWHIIAQDSFEIYSGPNPMGQGILPLVNYQITNDFTSFWGINSIEMVEDLIVAAMMNYNFRMDHLVRVMFPAKWIRSDVMQGKPESEFYDRPYAIHEYPAQVGNIKDALFYDRAPEITQQTFIEDDRMQYFISMISGMTSYGRGQSGPDTSAMRAATGVLALIRQSEGRLFAESTLLEHTGLAQECRLLLMLAAQNIVDDLQIRTRTPQGGSRWTTIEAANLSEKYNIKTHGSRFIAQRQEQFQKLMSIYPLWNQDPMIDQMELRKETAEASGAFRRPDKIVLEQPPAPPAMQGMEGMAGPPQGAGMPMGSGAMPQRTAVNSRGQQTPPQEGF